MAYEGGLRRWFKENWVRTDTGEPCGSGDSVGESGKYCRPTRRINKKNQAIDIIATIKKNKFNFLDFDIKKRSLESIFINFIKGNKN